MPEGCDPNDFWDQPALAKEPTMTDLIERLTGRARFCRDRGEVKTPELLEEAAAKIAELEAALATARADAIEALETAHNYLTCPVSADPELAERHIATTLANMKDGGR